MPEKIWAEDQRNQVIYEKRLELFLHQRKAVEEKIEKLEKVLDMIQFKCWYYEQALADGNEDRLKTYTETPQD